jgi:TP901 family phage tail tape measure protein
MAVNVGDIFGTITLRDKFTSALTQTADKLASTSQRVTAAGQQMSAIGGQLTKTVTLPILAVGAASIKAASDFESSFAGVRKTVNATEEEFAELSDQLRELSTRIPVNVNELNRIAESAGQLGISTENIVKFTETMAALGVATNLTAEQAATSLARIANITGLPQDQIDRMGSAIVALGNNFATTESEIVDFATRIAGAGTIAGLAESEILAIGAAVTSVGVAAEAGGTAVQKVLIRMTQSVSEGGDALEIFARTAGRSTEEFSRLFKEDAAGAFTEFVEGLGRQGDRAFETLDELNLKDQRLIKTFLSLAGAGDLLAKTMETGNKAFALNEALAEESAERYKTFESQLTMFWNRVKDVAITLGMSLLPILTEMLDIFSPILSLVSKAADAFADLPKAVKATILILGGLLAAIGPVLFVVGQLMTAWGAVAAVLPMVAGAVTSVVAVLTGPVGWIAAAVALLAAWRPAREFFLELGGTVLRTLGSWVESTISVLRSFWDATREGRQFLSALAGVIMDDVVLGVGELFVVVKDLAKRFMDSIASSKAWAVTMAAVGVVIDTIKDVVQSFWIWIGRIVDRVVKFTGGMGVLTDAITILNPKMGSAVSALTAWVDEAKASVDPTDDLGTGFDDTATSANDLETKLGDLITELGNTTDDMDDLDDSVTDVVNNFGELKDLLPTIPTPEFEPFILETDSSQLETAMGIVDDMIASAADPLSLDFEAEIDLGPTLSEISAMGNTFEQAGNGIKDNFVDLAGSILSDTGLIKDGITSIFGAEVTDALSGFIDTFTSGFSSARDSGNTIMESIKAGWNGLLDSLTGTAQGFSAGIAAASGSMEGILSGALSAFANFSSGNVIGGIAAGIGTAIGLFDSLFGSSKRSIDEVRGSYQGFVSDIVSGNDAIAAMGGALEEATELLSRDRSALIAEFNGSIGELTDAAIENINNLTDSAEASALALASVDFIQNLVGRVLYGGGGAQAVLEQLNKVRTAFFEKMAEMKQFMIGQSQDIIGGLTKTFGDFANLAADEFEFVQTSVLQAFNTMMDAGASFADVVGTFGPVLSTFIEAAENAGFEVSSEFERIGTVMDLMNSGPIQKVINGLEGVGQTVTAVGNLGLLTADQFELFGNTAQTAFNKLVTSGLTSEEAIAALAPQLQQLNDLQEQYGFELDANTQDLLDMAIAQGAVADKGLTTNDILIKGFESVLNVMNRLIEALGGVPVAFDGWIQSADDMAGEVNRHLRDVEDTAVQAGKTIDESLDVSGAGSGSARGGSGTSSGSQRGGDPDDQAEDVGTTGDIDDTAGQFSGDSDIEDGGFASGTGSFLDFGKGTDTVLHGVEQVVTRSEGESIASMVGQAIELASSAGSDSDEQVELQRDTLAAIQRLVQVNTALSARLSGQEARMRTEKNRGMN